MENLQFIRLRSRREEAWSTVWAIYRRAFPENEQWREEAYDRAFDDPLFEADALMLDGLVVGLLFHWQTGDFRYIEHFAIAAELRGRNLGSQVLTSFFERFGGQVILEIDTTCQSAFEKYVIMPKSRLRKDSNKCAQISA